MVAASVDQVIALFERWGPHRYDEEVSQLDHALQTAAHARADGAHDALVVAALLHDTGHLLELRGGAAGGGDGPAGIGQAPSERLVADAGPTKHDPDDGQDSPCADRVHEAVGARWLGRLFPPPVTGPIALHVAAKRYRCAVDPGYHDGLSAGSIRSLARQGGPISADEGKRFERHPTHLDAVRLRAWDDAGKVSEGVDVAALASYVPVLHRMARP